MQNQFYSTNTERSLSFIGYSQYKINLSGRIRNIKTGIILQPFIDRRGYENYSLWSDKGTRKTFRCHQLVALAFIPNPLHLPQVNHKDGNKRNNFYKNLEWTTNLDNATHAMQNGLMPHAKIDEQTCHKICEMLMQRIKIAKISRELNIPYSTIAAIHLRRNWTHISSQYNLPPVPKRKPKKSSN